MRKLLMVVALLMVLVGCGDDPSDVLEVGTASSDEAEATATATSSTASTNDFETADSESSATPLATTTAGVTESEITTSTEAPTATATEAVAPTATLAPQALAIVSHGYGQEPDSREVGWAFIVENPNAGIAVENSQYQVAVLDAAGTVLETDSGYINFIFPSERHGVAGTVYLPEGATAASIDVTLNAGDNEELDFTDHLTASQVQYFSSEYSSKATGIISSPFTRALEDIRVAAIAYDEAGAIIGGGFTFLDFVLPESQMGVAVSIASASDPASVELYASISGLTLLAANTDTNEDGPQELALINSGFGQSPESSKVGWGLIVQNSNEVSAAKDSRYQVTAYDGNGNVLATASGYINTLFPGSQEGLAGSMILPDGTTAAEIKAHALAGDYEETDATSSLSVENVAYIGDSYIPKATGTVKNTSEQVLEDIRVSAVAYDASGAIIGGGFTFVDFVPAQGQAPVEVSIASSGIPERIELYPVITNLTELGQ